MFGRNHGHAVWPFQEDPPSRHQAGSWALGPECGAGDRLSAVGEASPATEAACPILLLPELEGLLPERTKARSLSTYLRSTNPGTAGSGSGWLCDPGQAHSLL